MKLIVGLGNIGKDYEKTRHNVGFDALDFIASKNNFEFQKDTKHKADTALVRMYDQKILFAKPRTYMNLSGEAVIALINYYKIEIEDIIVVYDDIDTEVGQIRIRKFGSSGTHNGMRNIISILKTDKFPRIRIGIGKPDYDLKDYVLSKFETKEREDISKAIENTSLAINTILEKDIDTAMNTYNKRL